MSGLRDVDPDAGPADPRMAAYLEGRHHPRHALPPRATYLATVESALAGYVAGHLTRRYGCDGEVQYLYVAKVHRRAGVATALLRQIAQWFVENGAARICVDVNDESPGARPFYLSRGAQQLRPHWMVWPDVTSVLAPAQSMTANDDLASHRFYHGTKANLKPGDLIEPGYNSNFGTRKKAAYVYLTATLDAATWGAELARGEGPGRIYIVDPTGPIEDDPNLTDKKFPGNPTRSYRSRNPLRVTGEVTDWQGHSPEELKAMKDHLERLRRLGVEAIED